MKPAICLFASFLCLSPRVWAGDVSPESAAAFWRESGQQRQTKIDNCRERIKETKASLRASRRGSEAAKRYLGDLEKFQRQLKGLEDKGAIYVPDLLAPASVGSIGSLSSVTVIQVIDDQSMIVEGRPPVGVFAPPGDRIIFWLDGVSTEGVADDAAIVLPRPVEVAGTRRYDTAGGSTKTVKVLRPFDVDAAKKFRPVD